MPWLSIGASLVGGLLQSDAASGAADAQAAGTAAATAENRRQFDLTREDYRPGRTIGNNALAALAQYFGVSTGAGGVGGGTGAGGLSEADIRAMLAPQFTSAATRGGYEEAGREGASQWVSGQPGAVNQAGLDAAVQARLAQQPQGGAASPVAGSGSGSADAIDPTQDPGYQFGLQQGQQALDRKFAASGGRVSGAALKAAQEYGVNYATTGYNAAYQRRQDRLNRLQALAGIGQTATAGSAAAGDAAAGRNSALYASQGDAMGASQLARGNIWGDTTNQLSAIAQKWINKPQAPWPTDMGQSWHYDK